MTEVTSIIFRVGKGQLNQVRFAATDASKRPTARKLLAALPGKTVIFADGVAKTDFITAVQMLSEGSGLADEARAALAALGIAAKPAAEEVVGEGEPVGNQTVSIRLPAGTPLRVSDVVPRLGSNNSAAVKETLSAILNPKLDLGRHSLYDLQAIRKAIIDQNLPQHQDKSRGGVSDLAGQALARLDTAIAKLSAPTLPATLAPSRPAAIFRDLGAPVASPPSPSPSPEFTPITSGPAPTPMPAPKSPASTSLERPLPAGVKYLSAADLYELERPDSSAQKVADILDKIIRGDLRLKLEAREANFNQAVGKTLCDLAEGTLLPEALRTRAQAAHDKLWPKPARPAKLAAPVAPAPMPELTLIPSGPTPELSPAAPEPAPAPAAPEASFDIEVFPPTAGEVVGLGEPGTKVAAIPPALAPSSVEGPVREIADIAGWEEVGAPPPPPAEALEEAAVENTTRTQTAQAKLAEIKATTPASKLAAAKETISGKQAVQAAELQSAQTKAAAAKDDHAVEVEIAASYQTTIEAAGKAFVDEWTKLKADYDQLIKDKAAAVAQAKEKFLAGLSPAARARFADPSRSIPVVSTVQNSFEERISRLLKRIIDKYGIELPPSCQGAESELDAIQAALTQKAETARKDEEKRIYKDLAYQTDRTDKAKTRLDEADIAVVRLNAVVADLSARHTNLEEITTALAAAQQAAAALSEQITDVLYSLSPSTTPAEPELLPAERELADFEKSDPLVLADKMARARLAITTARVEIITAQESLIWDNHFIDQMVAIAPSSVATEVKATADKQKGTNLDREKHLASEIDQMDEKLNALEESFAAVQAGFANINRGIEAALASLSV